MPMLCKSMTASWFLAFVSAPTIASAAASDLRLETSRLANIKRIANSGSARREWRTLLTYLRTGPTFKVRLRSANLLMRVSNEQLKDALVKIASDRNVKGGVYFWSNATHTARMRNVRVRVISR